MRGLSGPPRSSSRSVAPSTQLHHRVRRLTLAADVVDRQDVGVAERRDDAGFALEARERLRVVGETLGEHLDRDVALQPRVPGAIHLAHSAGA